MLARVQEEIDRVLGDRTPTYDDLKSLLVGVYVIIYLFGWMNIDVCVCMTPPRQKNNTPTNNTSSQKPIQTNHRTSAWP